MPRTRPILRLSVPALAASLAVVIPLTLATTGCSSSGTTRKDPTVSTEVVNGSSHTVRVSMHVGERVRLGGNPITPLKDGKAVEIPRGEGEPLRIRRPNEVMLFGARQDEELVYWLRVEIITPSWDDESVTWFELLGPPARQINIKNATGRGATGVVADSVSVPIRPLAPELYPMRDRNYAFQEPPATE